MENKVNINVSNLTAHPKQAEVYSAGLDEAFVASIETRGIIQPLLVAANATVRNGSVSLRDNNNDPYVVVSGHRRLEAAISLGFSEVPCVLKKYYGEEEIDFDFLASNIFRGKSRKEKEREFLVWKAVLNKIANHKKTMVLRGGNKDIVNTMIWGKESSHKWNKEQLFSLCEKLGIDPDENINGVKIIEKATGITEWEQRQINSILSDDYLETQVKKLARFGLPDNKINAFAESWLKIRTDYSAGVLDTTTAFNTMEDLRKSALKTKKKKKSAKTEQKKPTAYLCFPVTGDLGFAQKIFAVAKDARPEYYCVVPTEICSPVYTWIEAMEFLIPKLIAADVLINITFLGLDELPTSTGCRIERAVANALNKRKIDLHLGSYLLEEYLNTKNGGEL